MIKFHRHSGMNGRQAGLSQRRVVTLYIWICAIWVRKNYWNVCRLSVSWRKPTLALIRSRNLSLFARQRITPWVASKPINNVKPVSKGCLLLANALPSVCMAQIVLVLTHWQSLSYSVVWRVKKRSDVLRKRHQPMKMHCLHRFKILRLNSINC